MQQRTFSQKNWLIELILCNQNKMKEIASKIINCKKEHRSEAIAVGKIATKRTN